MYRSLRVAVVIPAYNEELLIGKTINSIPDFVDHIIVVNDGSTDQTQHKLDEFKKTNKKLIALKNEVNLGVGGAIVNGLKYSLDKTKAEAIGIVAGDAQFDTSYLQPMLDKLIDQNYDYVKASRFYHRDALKHMPRYRQVGNVIISLLTKFATGYYSVTDITNGCGFLRRSAIERLRFDIIQYRYDHEVSMLTALSIANASVKDYAVPAIYGEETSNIKLFSTVLRNLRTVWRGFWRRIYYKYILFDFHPIALFLLSGLLLMAVGIGFGLYALYERLFSQLSPSTGTVGLIILPVILGFQLLLTALVMDVGNENKS